MNKLSTATLSELIPGAKAPSYKASSVTVGVIHFGAGNFHRAHQAVYCDALLNSGEKKWAITGVSLRSSNMRDKLAPQNFLYTEATLGDATTYRIIGAIQNLLVAREEPLAIINAVAHDNTQLATTTITEKGYCLRNEEVDQNHPDITQDIESLKSPQTIYGYLAAGLIKRCTNLGQPITILCCDNIHAGGEHLRNGVEILLRHHCKDTLAWITENVAFSSSMVDRVTPATNDSLIAEVSEKIGLFDAAPVAAEPFTQWIIENNFAGERPPFDRVGALFVDDIAPFERVKLRFLNAGHSILATFGYLAGDRFIHEALQRPALARFTEHALKQNVLPVTSVPKTINGEAYIDDVLERFRNPNLPYAVLQVGTDSSQKIQQRWLPTIDDALAQGKDISCLAFALAAWVSFIRKALANKDLNDPLTDIFEQHKFIETVSNLQTFLALTGANRFDFHSNDLFMLIVHQYQQAIDELGIELALSTHFFNLQQSEGLQ